MTALEGLANTIRGMDERVRNPMGVWPRVGNVVARMNAKAFATKGASTGKPWAPLAASTVAEKMKHGWPSSPLVRTGKMKASFTGRPMGIERYYGKQAVYGADGQIPIWQQKGTRRHGRRHIPPRLIQKLDPQARAEIKKIIVGWVVKGVAS